MFDGLYSVLKDFFFFVYYWATEVPAVWLTGVWAMLPEQFTQSEQIQMLVEAVIVGNHWFPLREGYSLAVNVLNLRVLVAFLKTVWRFIPVIGA